MMDKQKRSDEADDFSSREYPLTERIESQRRAWKLERTSLWILLSAVLLAFTGIFSNGPLSTARQLDDSGRLRVEYERFERLGASSRLRITLRGAAGEEARLLVTGDLLTSHDFRDLQPASTVSRSSHGGLELRGPLDENGELHLQIALLATKAGLLHHQFEYAGTRVTFRQLVYP